MKMNPILKNLTAALILFFFFAPAAFAQQPAQVEQKNKIYEFNITSKLSTEDAQKLDATMLGRKGILSSHTNPQTGKIIVKVIPGIDFDALRTVVNYAGFECNSENLTVRDE